MAHLVILYTSNLEAEAEVGSLCRKLADALVAVRDEDSKPIFPPGGVRVFAYPAPHFAVADGSRDYAFVYLNMRMGRGRSRTVKQRAGDAAVAAAHAHFEPLFASRHIGVTLQVDEGQEVFDSKKSTIHPLFARS